MTLIAGADTLIGAALLRALVAAGQPALGVDAATCLDPVALAAVFAEAKPTRVFALAGPTGGIHANLAHPADLARANLLAAVHVFEAAHRANVDRLVFLGSSCCYPRGCKQPMQEADLHTGPLEPSSAAYAQAKLAGMALCDAYRRQHGHAWFSVIPGDTFGPGDDFAPATSHVVAALMRRFHEAKLAGAPEVVVWGTGRARRDFLYVDDLAAALLLLIERYDGAGPINVGSGAGSTIAELAEAVRDVVGYAGRIGYDASKPDGMPVKVLDSSALTTIGWPGARGLREGLAGMYGWYSR
jgi:GDP-L-fucose synthase